jgi:hypothetical protein
VKDPSCVYRFAVLMLFGPVALMLLAILSALNVEAAPAPEPYAILEIEPPPKEGALEFTGKPPEEYRKERIDGILMSPYGYYMIDVWNDSEVRKLPSIAARKDPRNLLARNWIGDNLRVTWESEGNRLKIRFRAGNRTEPVTILNALPGSYLRSGKERQKFLEWCLSVDENHIRDLEKRIKSTRDLRDIAEYQKGIDNLRLKRIPERLAAIARYKQIAVIKWAK